MLKSRDIRGIQARKRPCALYRHFDKDRRLLYVGISISVLERHVKHRAAASWFFDVRTITVEHFATIYEAEDAEAKAIASESPVHNKALSEIAAAARHTGPAGTLPLSEREKLVLNLLNDGLSVTEVSAELLLSVKTVSTYRSRILTKLNLNTVSTVSLVNRAREIGLCAAPVGARP